MWVRLRQACPSYEPLGDPAHAPTVIRPSTDPSPDTIIGGKYKLLENIGEGGMGSVWVAMQQHPVKRKVAIKLIKPGMDSKQVLARFEAERQALAVMDHPNIAKVFDGGLTEQGRPYFVMEYVKGVPFTDYCDKAKLPLNDRLKLFIAVCSAVQHAHHKGIVHRDLKPSNILVCLYDGNPVPKVIDFGLAKAMHQPLTEASIFTGHGVMVGTPLYMSPEQAEHNNLDIDTRTDIYSLGVVLYELLTGTTPLERQQLKDAALHEMLRLIKEVEPPRPSTRLSSNASLPSIAAQRSIDPKQLSRSLSGDLDWVAMKALEKERSRRYETANGLARDIERFLNEEPVEACPPSTMYRLKKYIKRHKAPVTAATLVVLTLIGGIIGTSWGLRRAKIAEGKAIASEGQTAKALVDVTKEQERAEAEKVKAEDAKNFAEAETARANSETQKLQRQAYRHGLQSAHRAITAGELDAASRILAELPEKLRGWEWGYLVAESDVSLGSVKTPAGTSIRKMAPNGTFALLKHDSAPNGPFPLMRSIDGEIVESVSLPPISSLISVAMSKDAGRIAFLAVTQPDPAIGFETTIFVWDRRTQRLIWKQQSSIAKTGTLLGFGDDVGLSISADGHRVAAWGLTGRSKGSDSGLGLYKDIKGLDWSDGCCVFDIDLISHINTIGGGSPGLLNENGTYVLGQWPGYLSSVSATESQRQDEELRSQSVFVDEHWMLSGNPSIGCVLTDDKWQIRNLATGINQETLIKGNGKARLKIKFNVGTMEAVSIDWHQLQYFNINPSSSPERFRLGAVPVECGEVYMDVASQSVFCSTEDRIYRYILPDDNMSGLNEYNSSINYFSPDSDESSTECHACLALQDSVYISGIGGLELVQRVPETTTPLGILLTGAKSVYEAGTNVALQVFDFGVVLSDISGREQDTYAYDRPDVLEQFYILGALWDPQCLQLAISARKTQGGTGQRSTLLFEVRDEQLYLKGTFPKDGFFHYPFYLGDSELWTVSDGQLSRISTETCQPLPLPRSIRGDVFEVSADRKKLAVILDDHVEVRTFPELELVREWRIPHSGNHQVCWGFHDTRLFVTNGSSISISDAVHGDVLLTIPGDLDAVRMTVPQSGSVAVLAGRVCSSIPFRERWKAIQAVHAAEFDPVAVEVVRKKLRKLKPTLPAHAELMNEPKPHIAYTVNADESLTLTQKVIALRILSEEKPTNSGGGWFGSMIGSMVGRWLSGKEAATENAPTETPPADPVEPTPETE